MPKTLEEQIDGWCKHYNGSGRNETCKAGVNYAQLADGSRPGMANRLPCLRTHFKEDAIAECALREWHTPEEIAERARGSREHGLKTVVARNAIIDHLKANNKPLRRVSGAIPCPICGTGTLGYSIAYNGHCHGHCSTPHCVSWME